MENQNSEMTKSPETTTKRKYFIERGPLDMTDGSDDMQKLNKQQRTTSFNRSMNVLMEWPNWEIWPLKASAPIIAAAALMPGFVLTSAFRKALLLQQYSKLSSYLATMGIPAVFSALGHNLVITRDILEQTTKCPVCLQVKSAVLLLVSGFLYPAILAPVTCYPIASGMKNMYFPKFHKQPREVLTFTRDIFRSIQNRYLAVGALQVVVAMGMTYFEQECYYNILLPVLSGEKTIKKPI